MKNDICLINIIQTLQKLKASMSILIKDSCHDSDKVLAQIQDLYFKNATLYLDQEEKDQFEATKSKFMNFLETDQRDTLK